MFDDGIDFCPLTVDGTQCSGQLDYNSFLGHYNAKDNCAYGKHKLWGSKGSNCAFDYDTNWLSQNSMTVQLQFGNYKLEGMINFKDTSKKTGDTTEVVATTGIFNAKFTKADGSEVSIVPLEKMQLEASSSTTGESDDEKE